MIKRTIYLPKSLDRRLNKMAKNNQCSFSALVAALLEALFVR